MHRPTATSSAALGTVQRRASAWTVVAVAVLVTAGCSGIGAVLGGTGTGAQPTIAASPFRSQLMYPIDGPSTVQVPSAPAPGGATYVRLDDGWSGTAILPPSGTTTCIPVPEFRSDRYQAASSDFTLFDSGSAHPGSDFVVDVSVGTAPDPDSDSTDDVRVSLSLRIVDTDGIHRMWEASGPADVHILVVDDIGVGFSAKASGTTPDGHVSTVTVSGFVGCTPTTSPSPTS